MIATALTALALVAPTTAPPPAVADPLSVVERVFASADPDAAHAALSPTELALFNAAYVLDRIEEGPAEIISVSAACKNSRAWMAGKAAAGNTLFTYWMTLHWCHDNKKGWHSLYITEDGTGGETKTPGYTYKGTTHHDAGVVGTARAWSRHWFEIKFLPDNKPCVRIYLTQDYRSFKDTKCGLA